MLPEDREVTGIRHHGNFHLEQVLIVKDDVFITDFNGEPRRTLAERRRKAPAVRDVAGMIHSIDCAAAAALERARKVTPDEQGKLAAALAKWRERSVETFLAAYRETIADRRLWPADPWAAQRLIDFFLLEKELPRARIRGRPRGGPAALPLGRYPSYSVAATRRE